MTTGKIIFRGPSLIDGKPIVAIATLSTANRKTGVMMSTFILREDISPLEAIATREDYSICGNCLHRGVTPKQRSCYVTTWKSPNIVWKAYKRGAYGKEVTDPALLDKTLPVRLGAYGDPCAVPREVWERLLKGAPSHTGYTHNLKFQPEMAGLVQVSADSAGQAVEAQAQGHKTFRTRLAGELLLPDERQCPASEEAGKKTTCAVCKMCDGKKHNVSIEIHGAGHLRKNFVLNREAA